MGLGQDLAEGLIANAGPDGLGVRDFVTPGEGGNVNVVGSTSGTPPETDSGVEAPPTEAHRKATPSKAKAMPTAPLPCQVDPP